MLVNDDTEHLGAAERVALARFAMNPAILPPPHLREDLRSKGLVVITATGDHRLTGKGRKLAQRLRS